ncbi:S41 family peptidase [Winogradskyella sp. HB-48]|uniref:S41 family peptidase n=1 Tax=Winogradskyella sp. HB-48 TaxID=3416808 RepID=UPI003CF1E0F2
MRKIKQILLSCLALIMLTGCFEDLDDNAASSSDIKDFVWKAMNSYYLYNDNVPDLSNDRFGINGVDNRYDKTEAYSEYLNGFSTPEELFSNLKFDPLDPFSVIVPNFYDVLNLQQGVSISNGMEYRLYFIPGNQTEVFGVITLVLRNSVAEDLGLFRGQIFRAIDGINLNADNISELLSQDSYTLNFGAYLDNGTEEIEDDDVILTGNSVSITKVEYIENPIHEAQVLTLPNANVAYLMYNGFTRNFDNTLNDVFSQFQANNANELVLDLRYNGGGSIQSALHLASMITGQFNGQIFSKLFYNNNQEFQNRNYNFTNTLEGGGAINSLNLNRVYVLTTSRSASASELIINSLRPYIEVIHIGDNTSGKTQSNRLVFDSPDFNSNDVTTSHTYALIPLTANSTNVNDELVPPNGLTPDIPIIESPFNLGSLGSIFEPLLATALTEISNSGRSIPIVDEIDSTMREVKIPNQHSPIEGLMFED